MRKIYIRDSNLFSNAYPVRDCPYFEWVWLPNKQDVDIIVFSDAHLVDVESNKSSIKIAWLMEPPVINDFIYKYVRMNYELFDYIFTFDESLLPVDKRFQFCPWGTTWIPEESRIIHPKTKKVSAIFSEKNWTEGHILRHKIVDRFKSVIDVMGRGYRSIDSKLEGLSEYRFNFAIENTVFDIQFTEKIMDCFTTGTIPIYWGTKKISSIFDLSGIIPVNDIEDVARIIDILNEEYYNDHLPSIRKNFEIAKDYLYPEKHIWDKCISKL